MYILMLSIHGLIRGHEPELGRDADTGGQVKYVIDLVRALAARPDVSQVDLATRLILDPAVSADYAIPIEPLGDKARIVRIAAGPEGYIPKEQLWDHLDEFTENLLSFLKAQGRFPQVVHSHYADAGYVGVRLAGRLGVPLVHTGHSLGRDKRQRLIAAGLDSDQIDARYNMRRRIAAEELTLSHAALIIASTRHEIEEQYGLYESCRPERMQVIPPGVNLAHFRPPSPADPKPRFAEIVARFLRDPDKPLILALSRPDYRKNITTLVESYAESPRLRERANLLIVAGNRDDIRTLDEGPRSVLTELLLTIDAYDLYGQVAIPKRHTPDEVPEIYRLAALSKGVFINPALTEPFGLTLLEAAATGLPVVATENGGPVDIIGNCQNGLLVDPLDPEAIAAALLRILEDPLLWQTYAENGPIGVRRHYSWEAHAAAYRAALERILRRPVSIAALEPPSTLYRDRALFTDLDQSLLGDPEGLSQFVDVIRRNKRCASFGIATQRRLDSVLAELKRHRIPIPDVLISSLGTEIHYSGELLNDDDWSEHVEYLWNPRAIRRLLAEIPGLTPKPPQEQSRLKLAYRYEPGVAPSIAEIGALLRAKGLEANVIRTGEESLAIVPIRASKGQALRHVAHRLGIPLDHVLVAGGAGADEDMMQGDTLAVVVANRHHEPLSSEAPRDHIYFAHQSHARGILEAIDHYDFFHSCRIPSRGES